VGLGALDRLIVPDGTSARVWEQAGATRVETGEPPLVAPRTGRDEARDRLGLEGELTLAPLSAEPGRVDARALLFVSGVLELLGHPHALLIPETGERMGSALRFRHRASLSSPVVLAGRPWLEALPAADILIRPVSPAGASAPACPVSRQLDRLAEALAIPVAPCAGWKDAAGLGHGVLAPDIRENVGPVLALVDESYRQAV
jgi:hypothetical protein